MRKIDKAWWPTTWDGHPKVFHGFRCEATATYQDRPSKKPNLWNVDAGDSIGEIIQRDFPQQLQGLVKAYWNGHLLSEFYRVNPGELIVFKRK